MIPMQSRDALNSGYTFCAWLYIEDFPKMHQPCLYSFVSDSGDGFECFFTGSSITLQTRLAKKKVVTQRLSFKFQQGQWYFVGITHVYHYLWSSDLTLYINGAVVETVPLLYPKVGLFV